MPETGSMELGKNKELVEKEVAERRKFLFGKRRILKVWKDLKLHSERLGLIGVVDEVVRAEDGLHVLEFKYGAIRRRGVLYQAVAYAMLVSENFGERVKSIILVDLESGKHLEVPFEERLVRHVLWVRDRILRIVEKAEVPPPGRNCDSCTYQKICKSL